MNPWLTIPAADYEGHMSHESVRQLQELNAAFADALARHPPRSLAVLGCATGNGFEHIHPEITETVCAVDINRRYLDLLAQRHAGRLPGLRLLNEDVRTAVLPARAFDHIHAGLLFEYVDPPRVLRRIAGWLAPGGVLSVVLQLPSAHSGPVSETSFSSLGSLASIMRLVEPDLLLAAASHVGLVTVETHYRELPQGKRFQSFYLTAT